MEIEGETQDSNGEASGQSQGEATASVGENFLAAALAEPEGESDWSPPQHDPKSGIALDPSGLPVNRRLRAIALADAGEATDPGKLISDEAIAAAAERLAAYDKAYPPLSARASTADLEKLAAAERVDISRASTNPERAQLIQAARPSRL